MLYSLSTDSCFELEYASELASVQDPYAGTKDHTIHGWDEMDNMQTSQYPS
jgi:hypothetical protein